MRVRIGGEGWKGHPLRANSLDEVGRAWTRPRAPDLPGAGESQEVRHGDRVGWHGRAPDDLARGRRFRMHHFQAWKEQRRSPKIGPRHVNVATDVDRDLTALDYARK